MSVLPIAPVAAGPELAQAVAQPATASPAHASFGQLLQQGVQNVSDKVTAADQAVRSFVLDDSVPVHQVSYALAQARFSLELMLQVRSRLVEGYQQLMNMQI